VIAIPICAKRKMLLKLSAVSLFHFDPRMVLSYASPSTKYLIGLDSSMLFMEGNNVENDLFQHIAVVSQNVTKKLKKFNQVK
jgi:hypothetical protein